MNDTIHILSNNELDAVAGGLQSDSSSKSLVVMPDPGFVVGTTTPGPQSSSYSWGATQVGG